MGFVWRHKKKLVALIVVLLVVGWFLYTRKQKGNAGNVITENVIKQTLRQTVLATGQVTSTTDLSLSFKTSGIVKAVNAKVGSQVKAGDVLASLEQKDQLASLTTARASLAQAEANYRKLIDGASSEEVVVAQRAVDAAQITLNNAKEAAINTKEQQKVLVSNAYSAFLNSTLSAVPASGNLGAATLTVTGSYTGSEQGVYTITIFTSGSGPKFHYSGLEVGDGDVKTTPVALGTKGLYVQFSSSIVYANIDRWTVSIPNAVASNYVSNLNVYQAALETQKTAISNAEQAIQNATVALTQAEANLALRKQQARPAEIAAVKAQILSAQGQVQAAEANFDNTLLRAPSDGTITVIDIKVGELASALKEVVVLQDVVNLHVEANISEASIAYVKPGQEVSLTFDALGPDNTFIGKVQTIDPASTVTSGVVYYKVVTTIEKITDVKPGMTTNLSIKVAERGGVLVVPARAIIVGGGAKTVRVVDDPVKKTYHEVLITTGLEGDGGLVEVTSGLVENQEVVTFIKSN